MKQELQLLQKLECPVCKQYYDADKETEDKILTTTFGAVEYAICCCCQRHVEGKKDFKYQRRWARHRAQLRTEFRKLTATGILIQDNEVSGRRKPTD